MPDLAVWPTDGGDGSVSSEARWRKMGRLWVPSGVDSNVLGAGGGPGALAPTLVAGPTINVAAGGCWLDGHYAELATPASVPASANGLLVVRFTPADNHAELLYRDGASSPTQTLATWELPIAAMVAGAIVDRRVFANGPGMLASALGIPLASYYSDAAAAATVATAQTGGVLPGDLQLVPEKLQYKLIAGARVSSWGTSTSYNANAQLSRFTDGAGSAGTVVATQNSGSLSVGPNPAPVMIAGETPWTDWPSELRQGWQLNAWVAFAVARPTGSMFAQLLIRTI